MALAAARSWLGVPLARAARSFVHGENWADFGYARAGDYARERLHRSGRWLCDLAHLGEALERLPQLEDALSGKDGFKSLGRVAAQWIGKTASAESVALWIELARRVTVRELREEIRRACSSGSAWPSNDEHDLAADPDSRDDDRDVPPRDERPGHDPLGDESLDEPCRVRISVPVPVQEAFQEALEIHRAVAGHESSVASFVEAMVAESYSGPHPPDVEVAPIRHEEARAALERRLATHTENWWDLECASGGAEVLKEAGVLLLRASVVSRRAGRGDARDLDNQLRVLIGLEEEIERLLGRFLVELAERGAWSELRFSGVGHYGEQRLGLSRTSAEDRAGLARALRSLPVLREAYERGWVGLEGALLVRRVLGRGPVDGRIESAWVSHARAVTVKRLRDEVRMVARDRAESPELQAAGAEDLVSKATPSSAETTDDPPFPVDRIPGRGTLRPWLDGLPVSPIPSPPGDASWRESLHRSPGMAISRIARLGRAAAHGGYPDVFLRLRLPEDLAASFLSAIESRRRALASSATEESKEHPLHLEAALDDHGNAAVWDCSSRGSGSAPRTFSTLAGDAGSDLAARTFSAKRLTVPAWAGLLALIEEFVATWDHPDQIPKRAADAVYQRDGWRCTAPGCLSRNHLEDHHIRYRSQGGSNDLSNRTCVCGYHHRQGEHGQFARVRGTAPFETYWTLGHRGEGGTYLNERRL